ncbi:tRNA1(Val) A37 N6-methylase TrmN6 [Hathewaya proteolytica DSM 3090]|uniref:tRNA1(Val) A37 N6-methylase TrmN6 n=1 Tax=Hathewaya proteolytica DSM 3090 TaxID=1121331 RepID=A0A1M6R3D5_9CLOT|nr:tRNA1(Val) (adenine(37)-N6)-methyltransferase [Hathewaya proteolytica]SHK26910.1 tRNA1(Val) A37 N6-methylase TrmN6 [Hathewaya proteolytica DSM 3090]
MDYMLENETLDDLQLKGIYIIQKKDGFRFGVDAVLLSNFARVKKKESVMDLCSGTGIVPFILAGKTESDNICGMEIQKDMVEMANRTVEYNSLQHRVSFINEDLTNFDKLKKLEKYNVVTVNPPYKTGNCGIVNQEDKLAIARHEICCNLEQVIEAAKILLADGGRFYMVHRPERMVDAVTLMRKHKIEPKRIKMVIPMPGKAPNIMLIEGKRNGGRFFKWEPDLCIHNKDGSYTDEINQLYKSEKCIL